MQKKPPRELTAFGTIALELDADFAELSSLGVRVEKLDIQSDEGFDKAQELLVKFGACGQRVAEGVQKLATALDECRQSAEATAKLVSERAQTVHERHQQNETMLSRFRTLGEKVRTVTASISVLKKPEAEGAPEVPAKLGEFDTVLASLIGETHQLKNDAHASKMKMIERNADSLGQSLEAARRKLSAFAKHVGAGSSEQAIH